MSIFSRFVDTFKDKVEDLNAKDIANGVLDAVLPDKAMAIIETGENIVENIIKREGGKNVSAMDTLKSMVAVNVDKTQEYLVASAKHFLDKNDNLMFTGEREAAAERAELTAFTEVYLRHETKEMRVANGETLAGVLTRAGASSSDASAALNSIADVYNPRRLRPGLQSSRIEDRGSRPSSRFHSTSSCRFHGMPYRYRNNLHIHGIRQGQS